MADETINQPQSDPVEQSRAEERIKQLSDKVELTSRERDEKAALIEQLETKNKQLEQENAFNSGFADVLGTHAAAKDHKDEIKAKVLAGYSVEDATYAVLGKAGKLGSNAPVFTPQVAGGSSDTNVQHSGQKEVKDMTQEERRAELEKNLTWN